MNEQVAGIQLTTERRNPLSSLEPSVDMRESD
jgi:hypothetical protein